MNIFGGNTGMSYDDIQRKRKIAEQLMAQNASAPRNVGEGLHAIGRALAARAIEKRAGRAEKDMRDQFSQQFGKVAPQSQAMIDLYNNPMASEGHKKILGALMAKGVPGYSRGGTSRGGLAVVGEAGPELVELPKGAKIKPVYGFGMDQSAPPDPADQYFREEMGDDINIYEGMTPEQRIEWLNNPENGFVPAAPVPQQDVPMSSFDDAASFQVAQAGPTFADRAAELGLDMNVTEAQRTGQALRLLQAESILRNLEDQGTRTGQRAMEMLPDGIENLLIDEDYGRFKQARDAFAEAAMRADTGATINESEWPRIIRNLMPQPGDGPERLAQRRAMREVFIQSLMASSGEAAQAMPKIGEPVVPVDVGDPSQMSDEELLKALGQ